MNTGIIVFGAIVLVVATSVIYRLVTVKLQNRKLNRARFDRIKTLYDKLENGQSITVQDDHNKTDLFPEEYLAL